MLYFTIHRFVERKKYGGFETCERKLYGEFETCVKSSFFIGTESAGVSFVSLFSVLTETATGDSTL